MPSDRDDFASDFARGLVMGVMDLMTLGIWRLFRSNAPDTPRPAREHGVQIPGLRTEEFLSPAWFDNVDTLVAAAGDLDIPPAMADLLLNITATDTPQGSVDMSLNGGYFERGHNIAAMTRIILPAALLRKVFFEGDAKAGMQGFMAGLITLEGDTNGLMALQSAYPSNAYRALFRRIMALTR